MAAPNLLDILKRNGSDPLVGLIDETVKAHPEFAYFARTIKGLNYKTLVRTSLPTVGFRNVNEGYAATVGQVENRLVECYLMTPRWQCDRAVADASEDGPEMFIASEAGAILEASLQFLATQFYYGTASDANKGFPGLIAAYDSTDMVVDAGGTTASTGSSLWAVRFGEKDTAWVWGLNGKLGVGDVRIETVLDANSLPYTAYVQELENARPGLQVGSKYSVGRIKKLTADSGKTLSDALISQLLEKFPAGLGPDAMFCSRRSLGQLQRSRTATNATGAPAPIPTESFGVPIFASDAILNTEALTL